MAAAHWKRAMKIALALFRPGFNSSKCKTMAKMTVARIKLLRNKREVVVRQMRRDIAMLLETRQDSTARIRVEHVIREQNMLAANDIIELFCELIVSRLPTITKQRECPADLKESISSLIFAAPRCSEIPELQRIRDVFEKKYGKDFVSEATDLRPNAAVNRMLIEKMSVKTPSGEVKLKIMKEIAKEYQVEWDMMESEVELLKAPEERIEGPNTFVSATSLPIKPVYKQSVDQITNHGNFEDPASAAKAAAESARQAMAAAAAAAYLANQNLRQSTAGHIHPQIIRRHSCNGNPDVKYDESDCDEEIEMEGCGDEHCKFDSRKICRRHSYNMTPCTGDESRSEKTTPPPERPAPQVPRVHPKLPDYDTISAHFESLKHHKY